MTSLCCVQLPQLCWLTCCLSTAFSWDRLCLQAKGKIESGVRHWDPAKDPNAQVLPAHLAILYAFLSMQLPSGCCLCTVIVGVSCFSLQPTKCSSTNRPKALLLQGDPFKTLFVARVSHEVTEKKLRRDFEEYGPVKRIRLVHDKNSGAFSA